MESVMERILDRLVSLDVRLRRVEKAIRGLSFVGVVRVPK